MVEMAEGAADWESWPTAVQYRGSPVFKFSAATRPPTSPVARIPSPEQVHRQAALTCSMIGHRLIDEQKTFPVAIEWIHTRYCAYER